VPVTTKQPDFFIVGAPKSGTTALYEYLRQHPDVFLPERKELRFFGSDLDVRDRHKLSRDEFLEYFADAPDGAFIGTAYVWYLYSQTASSEIRRFNADAKIIAMLRNPLEMLPALHGEHLTNGNENLTTLSVALDAEPQRRAGRLIPPHAHLPQGLFYSEVARYSDQLERYFEAFGRARVHVILFDDFASSPADAYVETLRFLGVRDDFRPESFPIINASKRLRSERLRHFLARPPELPRRVIRHVVPSQLRRAVYERAKRTNVVNALRAPVPQETVERLRALYCDEVERLSDLLGVNLKHWIQPESRRLASNAEKC
jgi:hypothetical protein